MTRYREKQRKMLIRYLNDVQSATVEEIARDMGRRRDTIINYLRHYPQDFQNMGERGVNTRWRTNSYLSAKNLILKHKG